MSHPTDASEVVNAGPRLDVPGSGLASLFSLLKNAIRLNRLLLDGSGCACS